MLYCNQSLSRRRSNNIYFLIILFYLSLETVLVNTSLIVSYGDEAGPDISNWKQETGILNWFRQYCCLFHVGGVHYYQLLINC
jgi:hypothetical protein